MKNRNTVIMLAVVALIVLLGCCCVASVLVARDTMLGRGIFNIGDLFAGRQFRFLAEGPAVERALSVSGLLTVQDTYAEKFVVESATRLVLSNEVGNVTIFTGSEGVVVVEAQKEAHAITDAAGRNLLQRMTVSAESNNGEVIVEGTVPQNLGGGASSSIHFTITVPAGTVLDVRNNVGNITIEDVAAEMEVHNNVGNVGYRGSLPESGTVSLGTDVGNVEVTLPQESAFRLEATTDIGHVNSNFRLDGEDNGGDDNWVGETLSGSTGSNPQVDLTLGTNTGNVDVYIR